MCYIELCCFCIRLIFVYFLPLCISVSFSSSFFGFSSFLLKKMSYIILWLFSQPFYVFFFIILLFLFYYSKNDNNSASILLILLCVFWQVLFSLFILVIIKQIFSLFYNSSLFAFKSEFFNKLMSSLLLTPKIIQR